MIDFTCPPFINTRLISNLGIKDYIFAVNEKSFFKRFSIYDKNDGDLRPVAEASWDYLPSTVKDAVAELKKFTFEGKQDGLTIINIENFTFNMQQNIECQNVKQHNEAGQGGLDRVKWDDMPDENPVKKAYLAYLANKPKTESVSGGDLFLSRGETGLRWRPIGPNRSQVET